MAEKLADILQYMADKEKITKVPLNATLCMVFASSEGKDFLYKRPRFAPKKEKIQPFFVTFMKSK